jgi:hypothetical protein
MIGRGIVPPVRSRVRSPPPAIVSEVIPVSGRLVDPVELEIVSSVPVTRTVVDCAFVLTIHAGGEGPLPGTEAGSGGGTVVPVGAVPAASGSAGIVAAPEPVAAGGPSNLLSVAGTPFSESPEPPDSDELACAPVGAATSGAADAAAVSEGTIEPREGIGVEASVEAALVTTGAETSSAAAVTSTTCCESGPIVDPDVTV